MEQIEGVYKYGEKLQSIFSTLLTFKSLLSLPYLVCWGEATAGLLLLPLARSWLLFCSFTVWHTNPSAAFIHLCVIGVDQLLIVCGLLHPQLHVCDV